MRPTALAVCTLALGFAALAGAQTPPPKPPGPCQQIIDACKNAGFIEGDAKNGNGLGMDCIAPIMRDTAQPTDAHIPLPKVSADIVAACKQRRPNFGEAKRSTQTPPPGAPPPPSPAANQ
jgi:hypothetical protein